MKFDKDPLVGETAITQTKLQILTSSMIKKLGQLFLLITLNKTIASLVRLI